jgi:hypothetical protein
MADIDFALVHADDAYLDRLGAGMPPSDPPDELAVLLLAWRAAVDAAAIGELVTPELAAATARQCHETRGA